MSVVRMCSLEWAEQKRLGVGRAEGGEGLDSASLVSQGKAPAFHPVEGKYWVRLCI